MRLINFASVYVIVINIFLQKVTINGLSQYKVRNSKGKAYNVTANEAYVYLE